MSCQHTIITTTNQTKHKHKTSKTVHHPLPRGHERLEQRDDAPHRHAGEEEESREGPAAGGDRRRDWRGGAHFACSSRSQQNKNAFPATRNQDAPKNAAPQTLQTPQTRQNANNNAKVDPSLARTVLVSTKLDTRIPQFATPADVEMHLAAAAVAGEARMLGGAPFFT